MVFRNRNRGDDAMASFFESADLYAAEAADEAEEQQQLQVQPSRKKAPINLLSILLISSLMPFQLSEYKRSMQSFSFHRIFFVVTYLFLGTNKNSVSAQDVTPCSQAGQDDCALTNEACLKLENGEQEQEICYACELGYVQVPTKTEDGTMTTECVNIEQNLTLEEYIDAYNVTFADETITPFERLSFLYPIALLISRTNLENKPYTLSLNEYSAQSPEERKLQNGFHDEEDASDGVSTFDSSSSSATTSSALPDAVDWVQAGKVTVVKNQGFCGCCWSVAAAGAVESKYAIDNNVDAITIEDNFSFQQMISCSNLNSGCNGGSTIYALEYANDNKLGGLAHFKDYPYEDRFTVDGVTYDGKTSVECNVDGLEPAVKPPEARMVVKTRDDLNFEERLYRMKQALAEQPVAIAMKADCDLLYSYGGGVLTDDTGCECNEPSCLDHAVLMVGYNDTHNPPYLLIKNSWGIAYGEDGYFRVAQTPKGSYGLFGVLSEGVMPSTNEEFDEAGLALKIWQIFLIILACLIVVSVGGHMIAKWWSHRQASKEANMEGQPQ